LVSFAFEVQLEGSKNLGEAALTDLLRRGVLGEDRVARQVGMFDVEERLAGAVEEGDDLERMAAVVNFELFRPELERAVPRADRAKRGRPPFHHVLMFKVLLMTERVGLEVDTLTIRIPMRLQRRSGRKLIMTPEGAAGRPGSRAATRRWSVRC
jgi:hypothetical protein